MNRLKYHYENVIRQDLLYKCNYNNIMEVPKIVKIIVNGSIKNEVNSKRMVLSFLVALELISGQKLTLARAKKSIAAFKLRTNDPIGCKVTLRGKPVYNLLDKLITTVWPRLRDFQGLKPTFDSSGVNYNIGLDNLLLFPELERHYYLFESLHGANLTIVTSAKTKEEAKLLLSSFQIPLLST
uniref:Large ribosomal subunit protein uL5c n=1 Tax=Chlorokybus atmophyticus TaxID=3144 RepID=A6YEB3_CHLAT|nr:ribosomal protein L5 [Chlorokybus atmophyticus]ABO15112.1 ribosomal protein L5 [Chlorokybus atmophyticus]